MVLHSPSVTIVGLSRKSACQKWTGRSNSGRVARSSPLAPPLSNCTALVRTVAPLASRGEMRISRQSCCMRGLGLFALTLQLILSFGHHHELHSTRQVSANSTNGYAVVANCPHAVMQFCPLQDSDDDNEHCIICWSIAIAGTAALTDLPAVRIPNVTVPSSQPATETPSTAFTRMASFQARAPPAALIA